jgi:uncharacterized protein (UPF0332 family)
MLTYRCEICGKEFQSGRVRKGSKHCKECAEELRRKGLGPLQIAKHPENRLKKARYLYQRAMEEFEKAKEKNDGTVLRDACGKGWLSTIDAANALLVKRGVKEEELPRADRGRRFMIDKYAERELRYIYYSLREGLHIEGYYDGALSFDEVQMRLDDLNLFIQKVEELQSEQRIRQ